MKLITKIISILLLLCIAPLGNAQNSDHSKKLVLKSVYEKLPIGFPLAKNGLKRLSSPYGMRKHPISKTIKFHSGLDLAAKKGTPIYASANGHVIVCNYSKGYGIHVIIDHHSGYKTLYGHMSATTVKKNQKVKQGSIIGYVGATGIATGPHLHYEIVKGNKKIDPLGYWVNTLNKRKALLKS